MRTLLLMVMMLCAVPAEAQPALGACLADDRLPADRIRSCSIALRSTITGPDRAAALSARASARLDLVIGQLDTPGAAAPVAAEFDEALADTEQALRLAVTGDTLVTMALIRLWRGDLSEEGRRAAIAGSMEGIVTAMTTAIAANPNAWELYVVRGSNRRLIGDRGADEDFAEARRLLRSAR